jgi:hypothetical protein
MHISIKILTFLQEEETAMLNRNAATISILIRFQFRADILNFTNLLNKDWGISQRVVNANVLNTRTTTTNVPFFQLATNCDGTRTLVKDTYQNASAFDVWQALFTEDTLLVK